MATTVSVADRLQPALLDRLTDDDRSTKAEPEERRVMSRSALRTAVIRDLSWLLNAVKPMSDKEAALAPFAGRSTLNFGLPSLSGEQASEVDVSLLVSRIRQAIIDFEPRIVAESLVIRAVESEDVLSTHNVIEFEIRGHMWAQPVPLEVLLRTQLDLEVGQMMVRDASAAGPSRAVAT